MKARLSSDMKPARRRSSIHSIVLAAGSGVRFASAVAKQFLHIESQVASGHATPPYVLEYSLQSLASYPHVQSIFIVLDKAKYLEGADSLFKIWPLLQDSGSSYICARQGKGYVLQRKQAQQGGQAQRGSFYSNALYVQCVCGGADRHSSFLAGLKAILEHETLDLRLEADRILSHDAARPLLCHSEIERLEQALAQSRFRLASLATQLSDTIAQSSNWAEPIEKVLDTQRSPRLYALKTPQLGTAQALAAMYAKEKQGSSKQSFRDLLSWGQHCKEAAVLVPASPYNHKLSFPEDMSLIQGLAPAWKASGQGAIGLLASACAGMDIRLQCR